VLVEYDVDHVPYEWLYPMAVMELVFFGSCLSTYGTFVSEFAPYRLRLEVVKVAERNLSNEVGQQPMRPIV